MKPKVTIGIIGAMDSETEALYSLLSNAESVRIADLDFYSGEASDKKWSPSKAESAR